jgi:hypothetical protein
VSVLPLSDLLLLNFSHFYLALAVTACRVPARMILEHSTGFSFISRLAVWRALFISQPAEGIYSDVKRCTPQYDLLLLLIIKD